MSLLLLVEHDGSNVSDKTMRAMAALRDLKSYSPHDALDVLIVGQACRQVAEIMALYEGINTVFLVDSPLYAHNLVEPLAAQVADHGRSYRLIAAAASSYGKDVMPRVAALLDRPQISDITRVVDSDTFERPIFAGNALSTVKLVYPQGVLTIRGSAFSPVFPQSGTPCASIHELSAISFQGLSSSTCLGQDFTVSNKPDLSSARIVVSGGRALGSADAFNTLIGGLADALGGAVGASRAAVDAGYAPNDLQVGQTGQSVAPDLYIAVGISGAIQHLSGMRNAKVIVAINKDDKAPIFQLADYALVGDLFVLVPEIIKEIERLKNQEPISCSVGVP
jgi:electron transfer flavoprotein alpha subunit